MKTIEVVKEDIQRALFKKMHELGNETAFEAAASYQFVKYVTH